MYCIIKCTVQGKQARVKNADLHHSSCTVVMQKRKICVIRPQCVDFVATKNLLKPWKQVIIVWRPIPLIY